MILTEKENRERIFTEFAQHITSGKLTLSLEERELIVKALNYYSLAKLQPEGVEKIGNELLKVSLGSIMDKNGELFLTGEATRRILEVLSPLSSPG